MDKARFEAERLAERRDAARTSKDFALADSLRDEIQRLGFDIEDRPAGGRLIERSSFETIDPRRVPTAGLSLGASIHLLYEGYRDDVSRFLAGLPAHGRDSYEVVLTDNGSSDGSWLEDLVGPGVAVLHLDRETGWAEARNAAAHRSRGAVLIFADLSVEPRGDIVGPLIEALGDSGVGLCGPWGLISRDMRQFEESRGPDVDAIEGYLLAVDRDRFLQTGFDPWFSWYRHADLDLSFRLRSEGLRARVASVPAARHEHRGWTALTEPERDKLSKRNFYRFLDRWKDRTDLLVGGDQA